MQWHERLQSAGMRTEGRALIHPLFLVALRRVVVRGPISRREHTYVLVRAGSASPAA